MVVQPAADIPGYAEMAHGIAAVWGKANINDMVFVWFKKAGDSNPHRRCCVQYLDAAVVCTKSYFIVCTNHAMAFDAADFCRLHGDGVS